MSEFDVAEVRDFVADLDARMDRCDNGEGMECANLDGALRHYAALCCEFREKVRQWGRAVFAGRVALDPEVERTWLEEGTRLFVRAYEILAYGQAAEASCFVLEGHAALRSALWDLSRLLHGWVTPKLAIGPSARQKLALSPQASEEVRRRIASLPPLPVDWQPTDRRRRGWFRKLWNRLAT
jgi:hypothetical protein